MTRISRTHSYYDPNGILLYQHQKLHPDGWRYRRPGEDGGWIYNLHGVPWVLYRLPELRTAIEAGRWIGFPEGERDADSLAARGYAATSLPYGAGKQIDPALLEPLRGAKVFVVADRDEIGRRGALDLACKLDPIVAKLLFYEPASPHKDVTDHLEAGLTFQDLVPFEDWRAQTGSRGERREEVAEIRVMSMEELMATPDVDEHDKLLDQLVLRGSRFVVGAYTGEGKSTMALGLLRSILRGDEFLSWTGIGNGTRALVIDVEQGRRTVKRRFMEAGLHEYPEQVRLVWVPDGLALDQNTAHIRAVEKIMVDGLGGKPWDLVIADPLYKLHQGNPNDERKAVDLMRQFDRWREALGFALVLPMHCRKPQPGVKFCIHDISGSSAYTHGAEVIVGLQRAKNGYSHLHWWKDREGDLGCIGERWGLIFDQARGFRRDPQDLERQPIRDRVRCALEAAPGMTLDELREETEAKQATIRRALEDVGAVHDGERLLKDRRWQMPPTLFDETEER